MIQIFLSVSGFSFISMYYWQMHLLFVYWSYIILTIMLVSGYPSNHELPASVTCIYYTDDLNLL